MCEFVASAVTFGVVIVAAGVDLRLLSCLIYAVIRLVLNAVRFFFYAYYMTDVVPFILMILGLGSGSQGLCRIIAVIRGRRHIGFVVNRCIAFIKALGIISHHDIIIHIDCAFCGGCRRAGCADFCSIAVGCGHIAVAHHAAVDFITVCIKIV